MDPMLLVPQVRSFNRAVGESIGALSDRFLGRSRPIGESRLLWEVGPQGIEIRTLRMRLGLDSGYVSRVLAALEKDGLVVIHQLPHDRRVRRVSLTKAGLRERALLERGSDAIALQVLEPLSEKQRAALVAAMGEVERLLQPSRTTVDIEDPQSEDARWCLARYFEELNERFDGGFDPGQSLPADAVDLTPPAGFLLVARMRERPIGCVALKMHAGEPAELKRMWISSEARGIGLGKRLLAEAERRARSYGVRVVRLETNRALKEAIGLYRRCGYVEVEPFSDEAYANHWFEKHLRGA